jgi:hypothetical protein
MIVGTYLESPGLSLTLDQAARFFSIDSTDCRAILDPLVHSGALRIVRGRYALGLVSTRSLR